MAALRLEVFETDSATPGDVVVTNAVAVEESRLASYEQGYSAGWADATEAQASDHFRLRADLGRNLQALGFTYREARVHVLRALEPLLAEMVERILPEMAREALAPLVLQTLVPLAEQMADAPVTLLVNPAARQAIDAVLEQATGVPLTLIEDATLSEGQVCLRLGDTETRIDMDRATAEIAAAVRGFFALIEKDRRHG